MKLHKKVLLLIILITPVLVLRPVHARQLKAGDLKTEYRTNPAGIDEPAPRFSWVISSDVRNTSQTASQIQVAQDRPDFEQPLWDTGMTETDKSVQIEYNGPVLESGTRYYWRVQVRDNHGRESGWSDAAFWETGLLKVADWQAVWIEPDLAEDSTTSQPAPMLSREFNANGQIHSARAYVTSHGVYEMEINGRRAGDQVLSPGWTSYHNRLQYQTYDITGFVQQGENAVGVMLGDGWYRGYLGWGDQRNIYGTRLALLAQIVITYTDGRVDVVTTDENWRSSTGPILKSDIYNGEVYDARLEKSGWSRPGFDHSDWSGVRIADHGKEQLIAQQAPPVRKIQELNPVGIFVTPSGDTVADMGQNMIGWIRLKVEGEAGTVITLRHAEVLDSRGNFYTENLRAADQTNTYILKGGGMETWEPRFTFQGFRYVAVEGYPGELTPEALTGVVLHTDMEPTGHFQSSNEWVNQLQHNIIWGQKGNFLDIPTDCPQRDERLGWTGDIQVFAGTANLNMNTASFLSKWLGDLGADQLDDGRIPHVVPNALGDGASGASGWADAGVIVPWSLYQSFGDIRILERQYGSMRAWVEYMRGRAAGNENTYLWDGDNTFGDWLSFNSTRSDYPGAYTDKDLINTAFFAHSTNLLSKTAGLLGNTDDQAAYSELFEKIKNAFQQEYVTPNGRVMSNTQTAYLLALRFDLLPDDQKQSAVRHLVGNINQHGHLTSGFLGTPHLNPVLSEHGYPDLAYKLLLRKEYPSWLYPVTTGATTIWERWDGMRPDGTFQDSGMNSFNHYAYGAIGEWMFSEVAGIRKDEPGYKKIRIQPVPGGGLNHARALFHSPYGVIESSWEIDEHGFYILVVIPANTSAEIVLPYAEPGQVTESGQPLSDAAGIYRAYQQDGHVIAEAGSGRYEFRYQPQKFMPDINAAGTDRDEGSVNRADLRLAQLIAGKKTRDLLHRHMPDLMNSPWLSQVMGFPIGVALKSLPEKYHIPDAGLHELYRELEEL